MWWRDVSWRTSSLLLPVITAFHFLANRVDMRVCAATGHSRYFRNCQPKSIFLSFTIIDGRVNRSNGLPDQRRLAQHAISFSP